MRSVKKPLINFHDHFINCVQTKKEPIRSQLLACVELLSSNYLDYDSIGPSALFYQFQRINPAALSPITKETLKALYDERMSKNPSPGRRVYDEILVAQPVCPFCGEGTSTTLDHYLPKDISHFSELSLAPINLVPACKDCNHSKSTHVPTKIEDQYFHPYYESPDDVTWLIASTNFSLENKLTITFSVSPDLNEVIKKRFEFQFSKLKLNNTYSVKAATEIAGRIKQWKKTHDTGGKNQLLKDLIDEANSRGSTYNNSWQTALYRCLVLDDRFQSMEWEL